MNEKKQLAQYSLKEEVANSIIHGVGILLGIVGLTVLLVLSAYFGTLNHMLSYLVYGLSFILLYTCSTLYHAIPHPRAKRVFKILDHVSIYLLIAGTYTPFLILNLKGKLGWILFAIIWGLAVMGMIFKIYFTGRFKLVSTLIYVGMGWLIIFAIKPLSLVVHPNGIRWLIGGGIAYTVGTVFYLMKKVPYTHAIWHLFVLVGSVSHFIAIIYSAGL